MTPTMTDAKRRVEVRLSDGRTAWLIYMPSRTSTAKAKVVLANGKYLSVPADCVEVVE